MEWTPDKIKKLRTSLDLSQQAFGIKLGVTREYVNKIEKGVKIPSKTLCILMQFIEKYGTETGEKGDDYGKK
jgi:DNA-binding transcriptional regulator YiaG